MDGTDSQEWVLEESAALMDLYFKAGQKIPVAKEEVEQLSQMLVKRATVLYYDFDEKLRNVAGLNMQLACIHYVVTNGAEGLSGASKLFYETYDLYRNDNDKFNRIVDGFYEKYATG